MKVISFISGVAVPLCYIGKTKKSKSCRNVPTGLALYRGIGGSSVDFEARHLILEETGLSRKLLAGSCGLFRSSRVGLNYLRDLL